MVKPTALACGDLAGGRSIPGWPASGKRRPTSVRIAASRAFGSMRGLARIDCIGILPAVLRAYLVGWPGRHFSVKVGSLALPSHFLATRRVFERLVFRFKRGASILRCEPGADRTPDEPTGHGVKDRIACARPGIGRYSRVGSRGNLGTWRPATRNERHRNRASDPYKPSDHQMPLPLTNQSPAA